MTYTQRIKIWIQDVVMWYAVRPCDALLLVLSVEACDDVDNDECQMSVVIQSRWPENKYYVLCVDDGML